MQSSSDICNTRHWRRVQTCLACPASNHGLVVWLDLWDHEYEYPEVMNCQREKKKSRSA